jgi:8-oxo-dGTP diphosphatase
MIGTKVEIADALAVDPGADATSELMNDLAGTNAILCSHREVIPATIDYLVDRGVHLHSPVYCSKGSIWEIKVDRGVYTEATYIPPPKTSK